MRANEFLTEAATDNLYHYTSAYSAYKILSSGFFTLQNASTGIEKQYQPKDSDFFLSATRSKVGDYHNRYQRQGDVIFNLDGRIINQRYKTKPVDYWERDWNRPGSDRTSESEDRIFSREPQMPIDMITSIHMILKPKDKGEYGPALRACLIAAKQRGIPIYVYDEKKYWIAQYTQKALPITKIKEYLTGMMQPTWGSRTERLGSSYPKLFNYVELMLAQTISKLKPASIKLLSNINNAWDLNDLVQSLNIDINNGRKPDSRDYNRANQITQFMRKNNLDFLGFLTFLKNKWKAPYEAYLKERYK
jgi:hypothetical protein